MAFASVLFIALFVFWIWAIFDCVQTPRDQCRNLPKLAWVLLIVLFGAIASVAWLFFGRPRRAGTGTRTGTRTGTGTGWQPKISNPRPARRSSRPAVEVEAAPQREITDRRSAELDRQLDEWERDQAQPLEHDDDHNQV